LSHQAFTKPLSLHTQASRTFELGAGPIQANFALGMRCCICGKEFVGGFSNEFKIYAHNSCISTKLIRVSELHVEFGRNKYGKFSNAPMRETRVWNSYGGYACHEFWKGDDGIVRKRFTLDWNRVHCPVLVDTLAKNYNN